MTYKNLILTFAKRFFNTGPPGLVHMKWIIWVPVDKTVVLRLYNDLWPNFIPFFQMVSKVFLQFTQE